MAYKLFPYSHDGKNQFRLKFDTYDEKSAFETAIRHLNDMAADFKRAMRGAERGEEISVLKGAKFEDRRVRQGLSTTGFCYSMKGDAFRERFTSLRYDVIRDHWSIVQEMIPFHVFNFDEGSMNWFVYADELVEDTPKEQPFSEGHPHAGAGGPHGG